MTIIIGDITMSPDGSSPGLARASSTALAATPRACTRGAIASQDPAGRGVLERHTAAYGAVVMHAELDFGTGRLQLGDPAPKLGLIAPEGTGNVSHSTMIYCADVDDACQRAIKAGATPVEEPSTFVTGDRFGVIMDPFGHRWAIQTRVEDVPAEEAERRIQEWLASQAG